MAHKECGIDPASSVLCVFDIPRYKTEDYRLSGASILYGTGYTAAIDCFVYDYPCFHPYDEEFLPIYCNMHIVLYGFYSHPVSVDMFLLVYIPYFLREFSISYSTLPYGT
ncbi:MAG: hypothetical protein QME51_11555 [Planctomycetota bacterium]|nr:hypothetical protein [Planctomycetota bacterium]